MRIVLNRVTHFLVRVGVFDAPAVCNDSFLETLMRNPPGNFYADLRIAGEVFGVLRDVVARSGGRLVVLNIPVKIQFEPERFRKHCRNMGESPDDYELNVIDRRLAELFRARGIPFLDLYPLFEEVMGRGEEPYLLEGHLSPHGHELAAGALVRFLGEQGLLPAPSTGSPHLHD
jgi:hypothetical protein